MHKVQKSVSLQVLQKSIAHDTHLSSFIMSVLPVSQIQLPFVSVKLSKHSPQMSGLSHLLQKGSVQLIHEFKVELKVNYPVQRQVPLSARKLVSQEVQTFSTSQRRQKETLHKSQVTLEFRV